MSDIETLRHAVDKLQLLLRDIVIAAYRDLGDDGFRAAIRALDEVSDMLGVQSEQLSGDHYRGYGEQ